MYNHNSEALKTEIKKMEEKKKRPYKRISTIKPGRKAGEDNVLPITVYIAQSRVEALGGVEAARSIAKKVLQ